MGYTLCVLGESRASLLISRKLTTTLGCGTMGVAIISGVLASIEAKERFIPDTSAKWESHTPGTSTPTGSPDDTIPSRFIATVSREETVKKLQTTFSTAGSLGQYVEVVAGENISAVAASDVVLLW